MMYAPKFRSWMTDWDRFDEALSHRLDAMADDALAEIHDMVEKAMPPKQPEPPAWYNGSAGVIGYGEVGHTWVVIGGGGGGICPDGPSYGTNGKSPLAPLELR